MTTRMKVIAENGIDIFNKPNGKKIGHYYKGNVIRTVELENKKPAKDGKVYVKYTVGGSFLGLKKNWVVYEDENGKKNLEKDYG